MLNRTLQRRVARLERTLGTTATPKIWTTLATSEDEAEAFRQAAIVSGEIEEASPYQFIILVSGEAQGSSS